MAKTDDRVRAPRAEQAVLGACLLDPSIAAWLEIDAYDFDSWPNRLVWEAMQTLVADRTPIDPETIGDVLSRRGKLDAVGGYAYLGELALVVGTSGNVDAWADIVRAKAINRRVLKALVEVQEMLDAGLADGPDLLDEAVATLQRVAKPRGRGVTTLAQALVAEHHAIEEYYRRSATETQYAGVPTGIAELDRNLGGLPVAVTTVFGARPSIGKTALALWVARNAAALTGRDVVFATWEDRADTFAQRTLADLADTDGKRIRRRDLDLLERQRIVAAVEEVAGGEEALSRVHIVHCHGQRFPLVARTIRALMCQHDVGLLVCDYLQKMPRPERGMSKNDATEANITAFDDLIGELGIAGLILSQLNREIEKENRAPRMSDLRDSGAIEAVAKVVVMLREIENDKLELIVRKNHQGAKDVAINVWFDRMHFRIEEESKQWR